MQKCLTETAMGSLRHKQLVVRALARILKLPFIFERVPVQNGLKLYKLVQNGNFSPLKMKVTCQNDRHDES